MGNRTYCIGIKQANGLTFGLLVNQLWSFAGDENRSDVNQMFLQPFFAKNWKSGGGISITSEITFNWKTNTTTGFLNPLVTGVTKLGKQAVSLGVGLTTGRFWIPGRIDAGISEIKYELKFLNTIA